MEDNKEIINDVAGDKKVDKPEDKKVDKPEDKKPEAKMFSQEEVDKLIEKRLAREKKKQDEAVAEAKKLEQMNTEEKLKYEYERKQAELDARIKELDKKELQNSSLDILTDRGYSVDNSKKLLDFLSYDDADACKASIDTLDKVLKDIIKSEVDSKIKSSNISPKKQSTPNPVDSEIAKIRKAMGLK